MEVVVLVEGEVEFMGLLEVCIMGLGDLVMVGAWVATVEVMLGALEDLWEEVTEGKYQEVPPQKDLLGGPS